MHRARDHSTCLAKRLEVPHFHPKEEVSFARCSHAARSSSYKILLSEEEAMILVFETCTS